MKIERKTKKQEPAFQAKLCSVETQTSLGSSEPSLGWSTNPAKAGFPPNPALLGFNQTQQLKISLSLLNLQQDNR
ncbi:hypothetical protein SLEP1_g45584 [Rubroshorea leprosula]|uniref:Uncharacterized protein n=1 Tax=Rubroshorea leprosula TaxID=152421 RepID=A0AAV5LJG6_9ROSI|nr:hypothetical protein SLEP1_g45584 [Rubroshorea leprosula]